MMTFNCIRGGTLCPAYFCDVCRLVAAVGARARLRSADQRDLVDHTVRTNTKRYGPPGRLHGTNFHHTFELRKSVVNKSYED